MGTVIERVKKDPVLFISGILAVISCFFVTPDSQYPGYVNWRVLAILGALMLVNAALGDIGVFHRLTSFMLSRVGSQLQASLILVLLSFFLSMIMTNDVTLVTLVPFALMTVGACSDKKSLMYTLILMTCAANLGSMMTPIGNPQNIYLYTQYKMDTPGFLLMMLPYTLISLVLVITGCILFVRRGKMLSPATDSKKIPKLKMIICIVLFALCLMTVANVLNYIIMIALVMLVMIFIDREAFKKVDYSLLITFVFFFVLIGNLGRIDIVYNTMSELVSGNPVLTAVLSSQIISNVPAAMLLSAFTDDGRALVVGTNLGGLGTLIASMASLITYKIYIKGGGKSGKYILSFSIVNVVMLVILFAACLIIKY
ncbi:MAG: anion permease [Saccharofermentans sp.]|nr:anion permease [Saccharofermentans sp.]